MQVATSIAEEGLDIPDCNLIIRSAILSNIAETRELKLSDNRFDLYDTLIQYIQSRGRARHTNSRV